MRKASLVLLTSAIMLVATAWACSDPDPENEKFRVVILTDMTHDDGNSLIRYHESDSYPGTFEPENAASPVQAYKVPGDIDPGLLAGEHWIKARLIYVRDGREIIFESPYYQNPWWPYGGI